MPDMDIIKKDRKSVVLMHSPEHPIKPVSYRHRYYKRYRNSNHMMTLDEISDEHLQTFNVSWDYLTGAELSLTTNLTNLHEFYNSRRRSRGTVVPRLCSQPCSLRQGLIIESLIPLRGELILRRWLAHL